MMIQIGCCGFPRSRKQYVSDFQLVEIQQTFYQPPRPETARRWREEVPPDFQFTLKAWQLITHRPTSPTYRRLRREIPAARRTRYGFFQPTDEVQEAWEQTRQIAVALKARMVVFQCPASFEATRENVAHMLAFFGQVDRGDVSFGWEPRGSWPDEVIADVCRQLDLVHVVNPFDRTPQHGDMQYFRLHGRGGYRYQYTDQDLNKLLHMCRHKSLTYCLFNNVYMYTDALRFRELMKTKAF
jgi:uncharacterized protein YecE (DUF72 family)